METDLQRAVSNGGGSFVPAGEHLQFVAAKFSGKEDLTIELNQLWNQNHPLLELS